MKWLLIVVAMTSADAALVQPGDLARSSVATRLQSAYAEWSLTRGAAHGIAFATKGECRAAARAIEWRAPDGETAPFGATIYKAFCKLNQGEKSV